MTAASVGMKENRIAHCWGGRESNKSPQLQAPAGLQSMRRQGYLWSASCSLPAFHGRPFIWVSVLHMLPCPFATPHLAWKTADYRVVVDQLIAWPAAPRQRPMPEVSQKKPVAAVLLGCAVCHRQRIYLHGSPRSWLLWGTQEWSMHLMSLLSSSLEVREVRERCESSCAVRSVVLLCQLQFCSSFSAVFGWCWLTPEPPNAASRSAGRRAPSLRHQA